MNLTTVVPSICQTGNLLNDVLFEVEMTRNRWDCEVSLIMFELEVSA